MDATISSLHIRYIGIGKIPIAARSSVDAIVRNGALTYADGVLDAVLAGDKAVYIVRRVHSRLILNVESISEDDLARSIGKHFAFATLRTLFDKDGASGNVVRFESQEEYVARFVTDLADGDAWSNWYYAPFQDLAGVDVGTAIEGALLRNREHLAGILTRLQTSGDLPRVLRRLQPSVIENLWSRGLCAPFTAESFRPLFHAALQIMSLETEVGAEAAFDSWLATNPSIPDWRDRSSLTAAVASIVRFLALRHGGEAVHVNVESVLAQLTWLDPEVLREAVNDIRETASTARAAVSCVADALGIQPAWLRDELIADFMSPRFRPVANGLRNARLAAIRFLQARGYVATAQQAASLSAMFPEFQKGEPVSQDLSVIVERRIRSSPTQRELIADVLTVLGRLAVDLTGETAASKAVRVYSALAAAYPRWQGPEVSQAMVTRVIEGAIQGTLPDPGDASVKAPRSGAHETPSECAGIFLLARSILDSRLSAISKSVAYPVCPDAMPVLLASLALRWAGGNGCYDGSLDPAVIALAGPAAPRTLDDLRTAWADTRSADHDRFSYAILKMLAAQRLFEGTELRISQLSQWGMPAMVANCEVAPLWPLASFAASKANVTADWVAQFVEATGNRPEISTSHELPSGWHAFDEGTLGIPDVDLALTPVANSLLRLWARWLGRFRDSSASYLLANFIRMPGLISESENEIVVRMNRGPLSIILDLAGYSRDLDALPGVVRKKIRFVWVQ